MKPDSDTDSFDEQLALEFVDAAEENVHLLEYVRNEGFVSARKGCMLAARYAEKLVKTELIRCGVKVEWTHSVINLVDFLPDGFDKQRIIEILSFLRPFATQASYPSATRRSITSETAEEAYEMALEIPKLLKTYNPERTETDSNEEPASQD